MGSGNSYHRADDALHDSTISITLKPSARYPTEAPLSPSPAPPEYPWARVPTASANDAYQLVRECLELAGLDGDRLGTSGWNPLGRWIRPRQRVLVLPNLVMHRRRDRHEAAHDFSGKCTDGSVVRAVCDYVAIAAEGLATVSVGSAPLQSCDHEQVIADTRMASVREFYARAVDVDIGPVDLRATRTTWTRFGTLVDREERGDEHTVCVDLGGESLLDELFQVPGPRPVEVRVGDYAPEATLSFHGPGRHVYVLDRRVLEADVVVSVPKLKTHEKVGLTCALKGTVGTIARKECLAHHRRGHPGVDGDEYPESSLPRRLASDLVDRSSTPRTDIGSNVVRVAGKGLSKLVRLGPRGIMNGAWYGNDTAWRMALDIARVLRFARPDGTLAPTPQRHHLAFVDGIVAGEGEGPLRPHGRDMGAVLFGADPVGVDMACALLMGFDPARIPLLRRATTSMPYPLTDATPSRLLLNGSAVRHEVLARAAPPPFTPPKGWREHLRGGLEAPLVGSAG